MDFSAETLNFLASLTDAVAWPVVVLVLLLVYRKPVKGVIDAVALRVPKVKEVAVSGVSASFFEEAAQQARENLEQAVEEIDENQVSPASGSSTEGEPVPEESPTGTGGTDGQRAQNEKQEGENASNQLPTLWDSFWREIYGANDLFGKELSIRAEADRTRFVEKNLRIAKGNPRLAVSSAFRHMTGHIRRVAEAQGAVKIYHRLEASVDGELDLLEEVLGLPESVAESVVDLASLARVAREAEEFSPSVASLEDYATAVWNISYTLGQYANGILSMKARIPRA